MEEKAPKAKAIYRPALSKREVELFSAWERERRTVITRKQIGARVGLKATKDVVKSLTRKNVLERLSRGIYLVRPFRLLLRPTAPTPQTLAALLLQQEPYYLGGLWALSQHRSSTQRFGSVLDAFVARPHQTRQLGNARLIFHVVASERMSWGVEKKVIEGVDVQVSDLERTLLDLLDYPRLAGGIRRALVLVKEALPGADRRRLLAHALRGGRPSSCQRLGVLLERSGSSLTSLRGLKKKAASTKSVLSMVAGAQRSGTLNKRWNVVENDR